MTACWLRDNFGGKPGLPEVVLEAHNSPGKSTHTPTISPCPSAPMSIQSAGLCGLQTHALHQACSLDRSVCSQESWGQGESRGQVGYLNLPGEQGQGEWGKTSTTWRSMVGRLP